MKKLIYVYLIIFANNIIGFKDADIKRLYQHLSCPKCDLSGAQLQGQNLSNGDFTGANLRGAYLGGAILSNAILKDVDAVGARFDQATLTNTNFNNANLNNASFNAANLEKAKFINAKLANTNFFNAKAVDANFNRAHFQNTNFQRADLYLADLHNSTGKYIMDYCANVNCPISQTICSYTCTNFCCTKLQNGKVKTDRFNQKCTWDRRKVCSRD